MHRFTHESSALDQRHLGARAFKRDVECVVVDLAKKIDHERERAGSFPVATRHRGDSIDLLLCHRKAAIPSHRQVERAIRREGAGEAFLRLVRVKARQQEASERKKQGQDEPPPAQAAGEASNVYREG